MEYYTPPLSVDQINILYHQVQKTYDFTESAIKEITEIYLSMLLQKIYNPFLVQILNKRRNQEILINSYVENIVFWMRPWALMCVALGIEHKKGNISHEEAKSYIDPIEETTINNIYKYLNEMFIKVNVDFIGKTQLEKFQEINGTTFDACSRMLFLTGEEKIDSIPYRESNSFDNLFMEELSKALKKE